MRRRFKNSAGCEISAPTASFPERIRHLHAARWWNRMNGSMARVPVVFPIRFATRNAAVQTTTRELSAKGVSVRCLEPPLKGTLIAMKLYLPGRRDGLAAQGLVREITPGSDAGFWADFHQLGMPEQAEIAELLARRERAAAAKPIGAIAVQPISEDDARRAFPR